MGMGVNVGATFTDNHTGQNQIALWEDQSLQCREWAVVGQQCRQKDQFGEYYNRTGTR